MQCHGNDDGSGNENYSPAVSTPKPMKSLILIILLVTLFMTDTTAEAITSVSTHTYTSVTPHSVQAVSILLTGITFQ